MSGINSSGTVKEQYNNASRLSTRISIHSKYSVNKQGFGNWIVSNYELKDGIRILELGCGTGDMWKNSLSLLDNVQELVLTDFSEGMLNSAKENLGEKERISYRTVDIQNIPYEDGSFDIVIANMMLYHVPDLAKGLSEVRRVLKKGGKFYCATFGENGIVEHIAGLMYEYKAESYTNKSFTLQNGAEKLSQYFSDITRLDYEDALEVTELDDIIDYIYSLSGMSNLSEIGRDEFRKVLEKHTVNGVLRVPKEYGMFVCK